MFTYLERENKGVSEPQRNKEDGEGEGGGRWKKVIDNTLEIHANRRKHSLTQKSSRSHTKELKKPHKRA